MQRCRHGRTPLRRPAQKWTTSCDEQWREFRPKQESIQAGCCHLANVQPPWCDGSSSSTVAGRTLAFRTVLRQRVWARAGASTRGRCCLWTSDATWSLLHANAAVSQVHDQLHSGHVGGRLPGMDRHMQADPGCCKPNPAAVSATLHIAQRVRQACG